MHNANFVNESNNGLFLDHIRLRSSDRIKLRNAMKLLSNRFPEIELNTMYAYLADDIRLIVSKYAKDGQELIQATKYTYDLIEVLYNRK